MMRKLFVLAMVAGLVGLGGFVRDARAGATVDLLFIGVNGGSIAATNTVTVDVGDILTMAVRMRNDEAITVLVYSTNYDLDLDNELDVVTQFMWAGVAINGKASDFFAPIGGGFSPTTATFVGSFQGSTTNLSLPRTLPPAGGAFAGGYQMGTVTWKVAAGVNNDGADIISGLLNPGVDGAADALFGDLTPELLFNSATVNFVPEPGTASLLGLGLVGLMLMGRRSRS
jgi:hypothetical protein